MTSSQWRFLLKVGVDGELISKKSLSPKTCKQDTAFLLTACCLALPKAQSSHGLNIPVTWIPRALAVNLVMASDGWPNSTWRLLIFCLGRPVVDNALSLMQSHRKLTPVTQPSCILIQHSNIISPLGVLMTMLLNSLLEILFPQKSLPMKEKRFASAKGQNFTGHRVWMTYFCM